jgi:hypothetical protein
MPLKKRSDRIRSYAIFFTELSDNVISGLASQEISDGTRNAYAGVKSTRSFVWIGFILVLSVTGSIYFCRSVFLEIRMAEDHVMPMD